MLQQELDCIDSMVLTLRLIAEYNEPSLEEYSFLVPTIPFVFSVALLCDSWNTDPDSVENL